MAELEIVVRARDQLTSALRSMGTAVDRLAQQVRTEFDAAGGAVDQVALGLAGAGTAAGTFGTQASAAAQGAAKLGTVNVDPLRVALTATRVEIDKIAATAPVSPEAVQRMADLEEQARRTEDALIGVGSVDIDISRKVAQAEQAFERLGSEVSLVPLQVEIGRARAEVERLRGAAAQAGTAVEGLDRVRIEQLERGIREGESALVRLRNGAGGAAAGARTMSTAFTSAGAAIKGALLPLLPIFGLAGAAFFAKKAADDSLAFTSALGQIRTEGALTAAEIEALGESARATARALGLADADAAPVLLAAVTDGAKDAADGLERYNAALRLSAVTGGDAKRTTDVLTSALNAYARQGLGAARAADVLFEVSRAGKVEIDALAGGLEGILPLASQLGIGFEDLGAVIVTATRQGGGLEQGVQAIRAALGALTNISDEGREALRGIDYSAAAIRARGLVPVLSDISARLKGNSDAIRAVFPDGRSFGALLAVLANDGRDLSDALGELAGSSGAVEDALGRKLQSPLVQLGIIFNRLRSELGEKLAESFARAASTAVAQLGGLEAAAQVVADIGSSIGSIFGAVLPSIATLSAQAAQGLKKIIDSLGGAEAIGARMKAVGDAISNVLRASLQIAAAQIEALVRSILLIPQSIAAASDEWDAAFSGDQQKAIAQTRREVEFLEGALASMGQVKFNSLKEAAEFRQKLNDLLKRSGEPATQAVVRIAYKADEISRKDLEDAIASAKSRLESLGETQIKGQSFERLAEKGNAITEALNRAQAALVDLDNATAGLATAAFGDIPEFKIEAEASLKGTLESDLAAAEARVQSFERGLAQIKQAAEEAVNGRFTGSALNQFLIIMARQAVQGRDGLNEAAEAAAGLRRELAQALRGDLDDKRAELDRLKSGLADARSAAELLGEAGKALDSSFQVDAIAAVEAEIAGLQARIDQLLARDIKIKPTFEVPETIVTAGRNDLVLPVQLVAGQQAIADLQRALSGLEPPDAFREMEQRFRGGIEPSLERQANAIDRQVARQRTSLTLLRALGILDVTRLATLEQATGELDKQADSLRDQAANVRRGLRLEAISLSIDPNLDEDELRKEIERVRSRAALETEAVRLGVSVSLDDEALTAGVRDAKAALDAGLAEIQRGVLEREAIRLGVSVDSDNLDLDVARARDDAQAFADQLQGEGIRREAITLGIDISGRSVEQIRQDIASVRNEADQFAAQNPIASEALVSGIRGFGNAIGQIASGAQTAKEALSNFFQSFVQQVAGAIAQALLLRAIISSVGGTGTGVGAFLASAFGVPAKDGAVIPAARGMAVPALAAAALAVAPLALGAPIGLAAGGQPVVALAQGGTPHLNRIVSAPTYAPLASLAGSAVVPLSGGGVQTTSGAKLPVEKQGRELVIAAAQGIAAPLYTFAQGGPVALYGEAGPEAIMRTYAAPGGGPGLRMASGGVAPLTRVSGGRLGVALAVGGEPGILRATAFALGGAPGLERAIRTDVLPFAMGGVGNIERTVATRVLPFALGGAPASDAPYRHRIDTVALASGGVGTAQGVLPLALGGIPATAARALEARPVAPVNVSVPVNVNVAGGSASQVAQEDPRQTEARLQATISTSSRVREAIAAVVSHELEARPTFRANVRGDRA